MHVSSAKSFPRTSVYIRKVRFQAQHLNRIIYWIRMWILYRSNPLTHLCVCVVPIKFGEAKVIRIRNLCRHKSTDSLHILFLSKSNFIFTQCTFSNQRLNNSGYESCCYLVSRGTRERPLSARPGASRHPMHRALLIFHSFYCKVQIWISTSADSGNNYYMICTVWSKGEIWWRALEMWCAGWSGAPGAGSNFSS